MRSIGSNNVKIEEFIAYTSKKRLSYKIFPFILIIDLFTFRLKRKRVNKSIYNT